jgi:hypothetical protein
MELPCPLDRFIDNGVHNSRQPMARVVELLNRDLAGLDDDHPVKQCLTGALGRGDVTVAAIQWLCETQERRDIIYTKSLLCNCGVIQDALVANSCETSIMTTWRTELDDVNNRMRYILTRVLTALRTKLGTDSGMSWVWRVHLCLELLYVTVWRWCVLCRYAERVRQREVRPQRTPCHLQLHAARGSRRPSCALPRASAGG